MKPKGNMYSLSRKQWNPWVGCLFECTYCKTSFQQQTARFGHSVRCGNCITFRPHAHRDRLSPDYLKRNLPPTRYLQFIFTCSSGDISFAPDQVLHHIIDAIREHPHHTFLLQSKNPKTFNRIKKPKPLNLILGTTVETTDDSLASTVSKAPPPSQRITDFTEVSHPYKMLTIEPIMFLNVSMMIEWIRVLNPLMIWIGYNSKPKPQLHEPSIYRFMELHWKLSQKGYLVILKNTTPLGKH